MTAPAPAEFLHDVSRAVEMGSPGLLRLLAREASGCPWGRAGREACADAQLRLPRTAAPAAQKAVLFTGVRADAPGRPTPRFPAGAEAAAAVRLHEAVARVQSECGGSMVGIAGGASGGDLLFHEACGALQIPTLVCLTLPPRLYKELSVAPSGGAWVERFDAVLARVPGSAVRILQADPQPPAWMETPAASMWARTNLWMAEEALAAAPSQSLVALWDGAIGEGPGGTAHMMQLARDAGIVEPVIVQPVIVQPRLPQGPGRRFLSEAR